MRRCAAGAYRESSELARRPRAARTTRSGRVCRAHIRDDEYGQVHLLRDSAGSETFGPHCVRRDRGGLIWPEMIMANIRKDEIFGRHGHTRQSA